MLQIIKLFAGQNGSEQNCIWWWWCWYIWNANFQFCLGHIQCSTLCLTLLLCQETYHMEIKYSHEEYVDINVNKLQCLSCNVTVRLHLIFLQAIQSRRWILIIAGDCACTYSHTLCMYECTILIHNFWPECGSSKLRITCCNSFRLPRYVQRPNSSNAGLAWS